MVAPLALLPARQIWRVLDEERMKTAQIPGLSTRSKLDARISVTPIGLGTAPLLKVSRIALMRHRAAPNRRPSRWCGATAPLRCGARPRINVPRALARLQETGSNRNCEPMQPSLLRGGRSTSLDLSDRLCWRPAHGAVDCRRLFARELLGAFLTRRTGARARSAAPAFRASGSAPVWNIFHAIRRAPSGDHEVDFPAIQLKLQIVAGELIVAPREEGLRRRMASPRSPMTLSHRRGTGRTNGA